MRSEIAIAGMKHKGIIIHYMNPFYLCIMVLVVGVPLSVYLCVCVCSCTSIFVRANLSFRCGDIFGQSSFLQKVV